MTTKKELDLLDEVRKIVSTSMIDPSSYEKVEWAQNGSELILKIDHVADGVLRGLLKAKDYIQIEKHNKCLGIWIRPLDNLVEVTFDLF